MAEGTSSLDDQLSQRFIELDPSGYFLIKLDAETGELVAEHSQLMARWPLQACSYEGYKQRVQRDCEPADPARPSEHESVVNVLWRRAGGSLASVALDGISAVRAMRERANEIKCHALDEPQHRWRLLPEAARLLREATRMLGTILVR